MCKLRLIFGCPFSVILLFTLWGCNSRRSETKNGDLIIKNLVDKTMLFPDTLLIIQENKVITESVGCIIKKAKATIVSVIWGDCQVCIKKINTWNSLLEKGDFPQVQIVFIVVTPNIDYFLKVYYPMIKWKGILVIDNNGKFYNLNALNNNMIEYNTFLINSSNRVVVVGDPFVFPDLMKLYNQAAKELNNG